MAEKHDRLNSKFSSVAAFWKPDTADEVATGTLTIDDEGIHFVTAPKYAKGSSLGPLDFTFINIASIPRTAAWHGFFNEGDCTLLELMVVQHPGLTSHGEVPQSVTSTRYRAAALVNGMHTGSSEEKCIERARYTFTSFAEWLSTPRTEEWGEKHITIRVPLETIDVLDLCVAPSRTRIEVKVYHELTSGEDARSRLTRPVAFVEVTSAEPESLSWFFEIGNRLENLFSLLTGASLGMETLFIYRGEQNGAVIRKQHEYVRRYEFFDSVHCTHSQLAHSIATWMSESDAFREIESLLLGVLRKAKLFVETEFLSLAQALEGFHRATGQEIKLNKAAFKLLRKKIEQFLIDQNVDDETAMRINSAVSLANQTSFRSRLRDLCGRISEDTLTKMKITPEQFIDDVVRMRNFFTHAGSSYEEKQEPIRGRELFRLSQRMRALLRGVFLLHLGFPEDQVTELIIREAIKWD
jgi:hypothetical protein